MPRRRLIRLTVRSVSSAILVAACGAVASGGQVRYLPGEVEGGARLYQANCTGCHGPEGDGVAVVNFGKGQFRRATSDDDIARIVLSGIPGTAMPPGNYSGSQAATIVAYLRSMASTGRATTGGDAGRGRTLVEGKARCLTCHAIGGTGSRTGPGLTDIGASRRMADLEQSLVDPNTEIRPENRTVRAITRDGATIAGRLLNQDSFSVQLVDSSEQLRSLDKASLRELDILKQSPMPSYRDTLTPQEIADVVAYLASLRGRL